MTLSEEEQYFLDELVASDYWPVLNRVLELGIERSRDAVLGYDTTRGAADLHILKARLDGAEALAMFIKNMKRKKEKKNATR